MSAAEESLRRAEELLGRLEELRAELDAVAANEDAERAIELQTELALLARDVENELSQVRRQADAQS